jgi:hypothetical protein
MTGLRVLVATVLALAAPAWPAVAQDYPTPEAAIAAYVAGVAAGDFGQVLAAVAEDEMAAGFDFVAYVDRLGALVPTAMAPSSSTYYADINRATTIAGIARQAQLFTYGLLVESDIVAGKLVQMDGAGAAEFAAAVDAAKLAGLRVLRVDIPSQRLYRDDRHQQNLARVARIYGADEAAERIALLNHGGLTWVTGFTLLRYGDRWLISGQASPLANTSSSGAPQQVTDAEYVAMLD